ncbi:DUF7312 domain-containing protein [Natronococcus occultus]|uniref:DUF7312 domain-containing protein n=1 Tax=Natronococcus occultus SP4 TaxID=694430 RepID=L0JVZ7_9EURY|nr:hypothetical protein [Natronococcus occultus]AGB36475.1 hypothetical protein Natoc_0615 [Natronococcus occultus SP4]
MAGDASGDRHEGDDGTRERSASGSADEHTTVRNVRDTARATDDDRIPIDLSSYDAGAGADGTTETEDEEDDPYAPEPSSTPIHPGTPSLESAVFVLLGAVAMLLVIARVVSLVF